MEHVTSKFDSKAFYRRYNAHDFASLEAVVAAFLNYQWHLDSLLADGDWLGGSVHRPEDTFGTIPRL